ncbi:Phosphotransferase [Kluyveromyces marxianus]|uniref:Phosphotransferase n=2 Tax=Kluyveromyces marxianus TaxID=4911 RepID=W0TF55_KLUMD|nr:hexokinase [Kluyveromyces marxianus DMKU3-1042]ARB51343.1 hexokinase [Kluyveromyces marxianus]QGN17148.1 hexokinase [Kluyveromyces marxianus]BAO41703.1 hexokinase [Kluyveromyces marxianus DMKU3-1042]BAP73143.1 hexokinase [Kluyveromyces marxianus]
MVHLGPKKPPARKGSMADVPADLMEQIHGLETLFTVKTEKMRAIVKHFVSELDKGLSKKGGNIPMIPGWVVESPTGKETGDFLALDLGGTNLRVVLVKLGGNHDFDTTQNKYRLPDHLRTGTSEQLWSFIAKCLKDFIEEWYPEGVSEPLPLGFTFSYPASQNKINEGVLQRWTKGFDIEGVEGHDVVPMLQEQIKKLNIPINVVALINDTTGTLVASLYTDPETKMGIIIGTGVNGAYYESVKNIEKLEGKLPSDITTDMLMAINCEYGSFDNEHLVLPRTKYDVMIDEQSPRPNQQAFEKMTSGYYLGEIMRLVLLDLHSSGFIFKDQDISKLEVPYVMDTTYPAKIEEDPFENLEDTYELFKTTLNIETTVIERKLIRKLAELVGTRAARLTVCGVSAICNKRGYTEAHIAADGSVFNKYPGYKEKAAQALKDIYDWKVEKMEDHPIKLVAAEDGSGVGAAIIAALTQKRLAAGKSVGIEGA